MVSAVVITSSSATIQWSFPRLLEMRNEIISIFYGTTSEQLEVIIYPTPSDPNMEQYSIQLMSLQPGTRYVYQIYSSNEFANRTDGVEYEFRTNDSSEFGVVILILYYLYNFTESSAVTSLTSDSPDGSTLVLNWQPPDLPNGDILNYKVKITRHSDGARISEQNVMITTFTATNLRESDINIILVLTIILF